MYDEIQKLRPVNTYILYCIRIVLFDFSAGGVANSASLPPPHQLPQLAQLPPANRRRVQWARGQAVWQIPQASRHLTNSPNSPNSPRPTGDALIGGAVAASTRIPLLLKSHMQLAYHLGQSVRLRARRQNAPRSQCRDWVAQWHAFSEVALQTTSAFFIQMMYNICCLQSKIGATCLWQHEVTPGTRHLVRARLGGPRAHPFKAFGRLQTVQDRLQAASCGENVLRRSGWCTWHKVYARQSQRQSTAIAQGQASLSTAAKLP